MVKIYANYGMKIRKYGENPGEKRWEDGGTKVGEWWENMGLR